MHPFVGLDNPFARAFMQNRLWHTMPPLWEIIQNAQSGYMPPTVTFRIIWVLGHFW
jgi:hypothetical protein